MTNINTPNTLGTEKVGKLLMQYSIPAIIATTVASLYNVIDRIFIGHGVGPLAISGLALTFPFVNFSAAFGSLVGSGSATLVSIRLGEKNREGAANVLGNSFTLSTIIGILFSVVMLHFLEPILYIFGASKDTLPYAKEFMQIILLGNVFQHLYLGMNSIMRASGAPQKAMVTTLLSVFLNLILAPVFIFWFKWGIKGAATATVCAQFFGMVWNTTHFMKKSNYIHFVPKYFRLRLKIILNIFSIGMSTFIMFACSSLIVIIMNIKLAKYGGDFAIGAFGIMISIINLFMMVVLGFNQGMQPIAGYNYGARQLVRVKRVYRDTVFAGLCVTGFGALMIESFPSLFASAFTSNRELIDITTHAMRIGCIAFAIVGFQMVTSNFFQSIGHAHISVLLSLSRQVIFLIPALLILPGIWGLNGVWLATPAADFLSSLFTFFVLRYRMKKLEKEFGALTE
jgi:putative MATE family efflux protein